MNNRVKTQLLKRKFSSNGYLQEMSDHHKQAIAILRSAIRYFYSHPPQGEDWHDWHRADWPETWEARALPNFNETQEGLDEGIHYARQGDFSYLEGAAGELHNIFRNLDSLGWKWWDYTDIALKDGFHDHLLTAKKMASLVWWTTGNYWRGEEILNEEITGPIDEQELLRYLKPGESA